MAQFVIVDPVLLSRAVRDAIMLYGKGSVGTTAQRLRVSQPLISRLRRPDADGKTKLSADVVKKFERLIRRPPGNLRIRPEERGARRIPHTADLYRWRTLRGNWQAAVRSGVHDLAWRYWMRERRGRFLRARERSALWHRGRPLTGEAARDLRERAVATLEQGLTALARRALEEFRRKGAADGVDPERIELAITRTLEPLFEGPDAGGLEPSSLPAPAMLRFIRSGLVRERLLIARHLIARHGV